MRKLEITDEKILKILNGKQAISEKQLALLQQQEELEKEFNKNVSMHARADEKVKPLIKKITDKETMAEYEQVSAVRQEEKTKKWFIEIADRMEEFKIRFKEENAENK